MAKFGLAIMQAILDFIEKVKPICKHDTAYRPDLYKEQHHSVLFDHCVPISLAVQKRFGGELKILLAVSQTDSTDTVGHILNVIGGIDFDGTQEQITGKYHLTIHPDFQDGRITKEQLLQYPNLEDKYNLFEKRILEHNL